LKAFKLDAYAVLDLQPGVPESDIKRVYRTKSLLIHPDKTSNPRAPEAFDRLKKASTVLSDEKQREQLDESIADARRLLIRDRKLDVNKDSEELQSDDFKKEWRVKTIEVLMDNEKSRQRRMKAQMQEEGRQQRKDEEEMQARKRKREHEQAWEDTREARIDKWRDFKNGQAGAGDKKAKKKKLKPLG
jgi:DnaJ homolog subfamily C member 8